MNQNRTDQNAHLYTYTQPQTNKQTKQIAKLAFKVFLYNV